MSSMYNKSLRMRKQLDPGEEQNKSVARGNGRGKLHGSLETGEVNGSHRMGRKVKSRQFNSIFCSPLIEINLSGAPM